MLVLRLGRKAVELGVNTTASIYSKLAETVEATPVGPLVGRAVDAGSKIVSPFLSPVLSRVIDLAEGDGLPDDLEPDDGAPEELRREVRSEREIGLAPAEQPLAELPLPTYESMTTTAILDALNGLTVAELESVRTWEAERDARLPILERIDELLASVSAST